MINPDDIDGLTDEEREDFRDELIKGNIIATNRTIPYLIYKNENPFFRDFNEESFKESNFSKWTETNYFNPQQIQTCQAGDWSDDKWAITSQNKDEFKKLLIRSANQ